MWTKPVFSCAGLQVMVLELKRRSAIGRSAGAAGSGLMQDESHRGDLTVFAYSYLDGILVAVTVACFATIFIGLKCFEQGSLLTILLVSALQVFLNLTQFNIITHNFIHTPFFRSRTVNRAYELICCIPLALSFTDSKVLHLTHHRYTNDKIDVNTGTTKDPTSTYRYGKNGQHEAFIGYVGLGPFREFFEFSGDGHNDRIRRRIRVELLMVGAFLLLLAWANIGYFLLYLLIIYLSQALILAANFCEHYGADPDSKLADSVSCYGTLYNLIWFNNGYHQEHHYRPNVHWTTVKRVRDELGPNSNHRVVPFAHMINLPGLRPISD
jgi:fatty acid desaturase